MTYSLSFHGWDEEDAAAAALAGGLSVNSNSTLMIPPLTIASGTVFGEILVWGAVVSSGSKRENEEKGACVENDDDDILSTIVTKWLLDVDSTTDENGAVYSAQQRHKTSRTRVVPSHRLAGHLGSVFSVKFGHGGKYIASTSDDRTVRLWKLIPLADTNNGDETSTSLHIMHDSQSSTQYSYTLAWIGWGHTARVWDVAFAAPSSILNQQNNNNDAHPLLVSAGEDSTARVWSPLTSEKEIASPLRGHRCESLWAVDVCEGVVVTGGNDGCVKLWDLESRTRQTQLVRDCLGSQEKNMGLNDNRKDDVITFIVPKDPPRKSVTANNNDTSGAKSDGANNTDVLPTAHKAKSKKKPKSKGQIICGMDFCSDKNGQVENKLLIATRAGGIFSLDLVHKSWTTHNTWSKNVLAFGNESVVDMDPSTGTCIGVHPSGDRVIVGTTEGWLILSSLPKNLHSNMAFRAPSYRPAQSIYWIDDSNLLVFYARGAVIWWKFDSDLPEILHILTLGTNAIPLSFAYDAENESMFIGDTRGNLAYFNLKNAYQLSDGSAECASVRNPDSLLNKVHDKEHITGITILRSSGIIVSIGNDGKLNQCKMDARGQLQKVLSIPIPGVTGLRHVWNVCHPNGDESAIIGGYFGNDFVMIDSLRGYEFLRIPTGGRQQRHEFFFSFASNTNESLRFPFIYGMAVSTGLKDGYNSIDFHRSHLFEEASNSMDYDNCSECIQSFYSIGSPLHAEAVNDTCWVECGYDSTYLLSGSNDCSVKLSRFENNKFITVSELPPHESCVRGVCSSQHPSSHLSLLVTCGGKLSMEFYLLDHENSKGATNQSFGPIDSCVSFLCSYRTLGKTKIDHRMNAVRAVPLLPNDNQSHLVVSGDSDGNLHLVVISEFVVERRTTIGKILLGTGRPVLSIALLRCFDHVLAFVGTTAGELIVWDLPGKVKSENCDLGVHCLEGIMPTSPMCIFHIHQAGVNDLSAAILTSCSSSNEFSVVVCAVGDEQAISACKLDFIEDSTLPSSCLRLRESHVSILQSASASPLKAVKLIVDDSAFHQVYVSGHDEKITLFRLDTQEDKQPRLVYVSSSPLGTEGSCIDCLHLTSTDGSTRSIIAVGGEGIELQSFDLEILRAAKLLNQANYLLITAGECFDAFFPEEVSTCQTSSRVAPLTISLFTFYLCCRSWFFKRFWSADLRRCAS